MEIEKLRYFCFNKGCLKTINQLELQEHRSHNYHSLLDRNLSIDFFRDDLQLDDFHNIFSELAIQTQLVSLSLNLSKSNLGADAILHLCQALLQQEHINYLDINLSMNSILDSGHQLLT